MGVYLVGYDLRHGTEDDYKDLIEAIKSVCSGNWWHCLDSTWLIVHPGTASTIRDSLAPHMHRTNEQGGDRLLVAVMAKGAAWTRSFPEDCQKWLKDNF